MFVGNYNCSVDDKGRISVPAGIRAEFENRRFYGLTDFEQKRLLGFSSASLGKYLQSLPENIRDSVSFQAKSFAVGPDGRFKVCSNSRANLKDLFGMQASLTVLGHGLYFSVNLPEAV